MTPVDLNDPELRFHWDPVADRAALEMASGGPPVWTGSLLPLFLIQDASGATRAVKAVARGAGADGSVSLELPGYGTGELCYTASERTLRFSRLAVRWSGAVPLVALYWGSTPLEDTESSLAPQSDRAYWPDWRCEWLTLPGARGGPVQSCFRRWDFGHASIPLGSFGPAMGTPYGAAYPRPVLAVGMGDYRAALCAGAGGLPDGAMTLRLRSSSACLEILYREDLWGGSRAPVRVWDEPLRLCWDRDAWLAYRGLYRSFPPRPAGGAHQRSFAGTWGDFRRNVFDLRATADRAARRLGAEVFCIDDPWESFKGSGVEHPGRLGHLAEDLDYARSLGLVVGIWQPAGWIEDYRAAGLGEDDLLHTADGRLAKANWAIDPRDPVAWYCLDPSSPASLEYLRRRTDRLMRRLRPRLLKLDFSYGLPGPDTAAPRDPAVRGERMAWTLLECIASAARAVDPEVTILGYSLHPLWDAVQDQVSLDDLGDAGTEEAAGHGQWSVWAALAGDRGLAILASSGYDWDADREVLLNTAVIGAPGMNLPRIRPEGTEPTPTEQGRRAALARWFRRSPRWEPLWLDTTRSPGHGRPRPRSWGRLEGGPGGPRLSALALREPTSAALGDPALRGTRWTGSWAVIAQGEGSLFDSPVVAVIPFTPGRLWLPRVTHGAEVVAVHPAGEEPWTAWSLSDGLLSIEADPTCCGSDLLGFLVRA